ncbi:MAG TPA: HlyD family efflux transporter periplasmic adaptor subunit, partial [Actinospica sp.]|nr:HlyD family efflux transporter periplasmic adaptor subunit [Actinospica sp.]
MKSFRSPGRRVVLNSGLAILLAGAAAIAYFEVGSSSPASASSFTREATVSRGSVLAQISASGNLALAAQSSLAFGAAGKVTAVKVSVGQDVTAGQVLATVDPTAANLALTEAKEQLTVAQDNLAKAQDGPTSQQQAVDNDQLASDENAVSTAQDNLNAAKALPACSGSQSGGSGASTGCTSSAQLTQDENSLTSAQDNLQSAKDQQALNNYVAPGTIAQDQEAVTQAQAAVNTAQQAVDGTTITAPSAGTVLSIAGQVGTQVTAGSSTTGVSASSSSSSGSAGGSGSGSGTSTGSTGSSSTGSSGTSSTSGTSSGSSSSSSSSSGTFITMADIDQLQITADVSETDIDSIKNGQDATITLNALPNTPLGATVTAVSPTSTVVSNVVEYAVTLDLTAAAPAGVRPGQSASILITTGEASDALYVPSSAVTTTGGSSYVTVVQNGKDVPTKVTTGVVGTTDTQIVSGLSQGETVLETISGTTGSSTTGRGLGGIGTGAGGAGLGGGAGTG